MLLVDSMKVLSSVFTWVLRINVSMAMEWDETGSYGIGGFSRLIHMYLYL